MTFNVLEYPIVFSAPRRLTDATAWHGLIPVAFALTALHQPRVFVELGTHKGDSYCAFCQAVDELNLATRCYAVDTWQGDPHTGFYGEDVYLEFCAYHNSLYRSFSSLLRMTFDEALSHFSNGEIDLLHIDGFHTYEAAKHDFESWLPKMSSKGVVILHDVIVRQGDFGVFKLWQEIAERYPTRLFGFSHGLGIAAVGREALTGGLAAWFGEKEWWRVEKLFAALGERFVHQDRANALARSLDQSRQELALVRAKIAQERAAWERGSDEEPGGIAKPRTVLQGQQWELETRAGLVQLQEKLKVQNQVLARAKRAVRNVQYVRASWLRRFVARLLPREESFGPIGLSECLPIALPRYVWPKPRQALGGMRRFLAPLEALGDRVAGQNAGVAALAREARLLVRFDKSFRTAKVVLGVTGEQAVLFWLEFGELVGHRWYPLARRRVRVFPWSPRVLYLRLPKAVETMALVFPGPCEVSFSQITVIAISLLEQQLSFWLWPLLQGIVVLRSRPWRRVRRAVKRYGWRRAVHIARGRLKARGDAPPALAVLPKFSVDGKDPYAYVSGGGKASLAGRRVAVLASSNGNFFMRDVAFWLAQAAEKLGAEVVLGDDRSKIDPQANDWIVVVAPHEFFTLGKGVGRFLRLARESSRLLLVNTEQPQSQWFRTASEFFAAARAVLDINYQTALYLQRLGVRAYFLPLGYIAHLDQARLPDHPAFLHLPRAVREGLPESYAARPIDVVFVGTASPRRKAFFARHAQFFAGLQTFIYLPDACRPFVSGDERALDFAALSGLIRRAKIVLNIHRDDRPYLEWHRIVNLGILQQALVISEHCDFCPALSANEDYVDLPLELIPTVSAHYLAHPGEAERFAERAFTRLRTELRMEKVLSCLFSDLEAG